ncbi:hypothetical protein [Nocardioides alcanivorans]|uniref:hypothetical protein n=1 Tax=Nocardioides alcanivorans TaxID=2897352 RepID=UPI001F34D518|nr:hypothetical protein [Nocardioides alcanivorans]
MPTCDTCGNDYDAAFHVTTHDGSSFTFDSIECAAHRIAPRCAHCECTVLGHGIQVGAEVFCCANCARHVGADEARDRVVNGGA